MAEYIPVSLITNNLTECPICTEQFEDEVRIPRRMPCCVQSICQPCLETYSQGQKKVPCPMCRCEHLLPGGVTSLAKEPLILRILEQLKIQKGVKIPCTNCPDKNHAVARCEECCNSLCEECLRAHRRIQSLENHIVKTFEELKDLPIESIKRVHQCEEHRHPLEFYCTTCDKVICVSCTVLEHEKGDNHSVISISKAHKERSEEMNAFLIELDKKEGDFTEAVRKLETERDVSKASSIKAKENVTSTFDSLIEVLELKKATLLSQIDNKIESYLNKLQSTTEDTKTVLTQVRSSIEYTRNLRRKADQIEDIKLISSSMQMLKGFHREKVVNLKSVDIEKEVDASKELKDVVDTYLQEHQLSAGHISPGFQQTQSTDMSPRFGKQPDEASQFEQPSPIFDYDQFEPVSPEDYFDLYANFVAEPQKDHDAGFAPEPQIDHLIYVDPEPNHFTPIVYEPQIDHLIYVDPEPNHFTPIVYEPQIDFVPEQIDHFTPIVYEPQDNSQFE